MDHPRRPVRLDRHGRDEVEAQEGQVRQVVLREALALEVGVDEAQAPQTRGSHAVVVEGGQDDAAVVPDAAEADLPPPVHEDGDLAVDLPGELRQEAGDVVGDDPLRREAPPRQEAEAPYLPGPEAGEISLDPFDGLPSSLFSGTSRG